MPLKRSVSLSENGIKPVNKDKIAIVYCIEPLLVKSRLAYLALAYGEGLV